MREYAGPVIRLIEMLLQESAIIPYDFSHKIRKNITNLQTALTARDTSSSPAMVQALLLSIWTTQWLSDLDHPFPDPTTNCLALMMLELDGSFKHPKYTTGPIARFVYCMRMVFMAEIYRRVQKNSDRDYEDEVQRLEDWFTEKHHTTFNSLRSLQHRASSIAQGTMSLPQIWWLDRVNFRTMLYKGIRVEFDNILKVFIEMERVLVEQWHTVLCGLKLYQKYGDLADDLTNAAVGYSFMSDARNPFSADRDVLCKAILDDSDLRRRFVRTEDMAGQPIWNQVALRQWLYDYAQFEGTLLVRCDMLGGSPGRGTELTAMTYKNIATTTHRNFVAFGKYIAMLVTYHKGTAMTGTEKLIPHALDGVSSDLIIQNLALARPFAELAVLICFPDKADIRQRYRDQLFVNNGKLFTTTEISSIMQTFTEPIVGHGLGVSAWRQISIAFKRKSCSALEDIVDADEGESVEALQATHTRRTENRLYGLSPDALTGVAEDILPLFLEASGNWQVLVKAVPGGLGLPYYKARCIHFDEL
ncbi:hypothetical protein H0H87_009015, partial [Tephrocybe sp. NHM501043]